MRVSPEIESLVPYKPGKPIEETKRELGLDQVIKLASNENPLGPSPKALEAMKKAVDDLSRYPDPSCFQLKKELAQKWKMRSEDILIGNGSNELIDLIIRVFCEPGDRILLPEKSFIAYAVCSQAARVGKKEFPLDSRFELQFDKLIHYLENDKKSTDKILFLANPNNPTGTYLSKDKMDRLMEVTGGRDDLLVVIDEAYNEFVRCDDFPDSFEYVKKYDNILVLRTFSKVYGLAGLRVGAVVGNKLHIDWLQRVRNPFNVNSLAQAAACAAISDESYIKKSQELVWKSLDQFYKFFEEQGLDYIPSQTNFVLFDSERDGQQLFNRLMKKGLLLRPLVPYKMPTHIRMSVGLEEENKEAMKILKQTLNEVEKV